MATRRTILCLAAAATAAGCFDVHTVDYLVIDDFSDPHGNPANYHFQRWQCEPWDQDHQIADGDCEITSDTDHANVLHLGARLYPLDGDDDAAIFTKAEVATFAMQGLALDVSSSAKFRFSAKLSSEAEADRPGVTPDVLVQLLCTNEGAQSSSSLLIPRVTKRIDYSWRTWRDYTLVLADFSPQDSATLTQCLAHVDAIKITVETPTNGDGQLVPLEESEKFHLYVDDISLEPK